MAFKNIREFIERLEKEGELLRIKEEIYCELEVSCITNRVSKNNGKALYFENPKGSNVPIVTNLFGSFRRMEIAIGEFSEISRRIDELFEIKEPNGLIDKIKFLPRLFEMSQFFPKIVKDAPCQEIIDEKPDLLKFPHLKLWPKDGGRFITLPLVFTKDLDGKRNCGMYRMQIFDEKTTGMHWHPGKDGARHYSSYKKEGKKMEVAVALGGPPEVIYSATSPLPFGFDEMLFAGFLRKAPVEMTKCKTIDLEVPAEAEIVLEGYILPDETRDEGPFGDHTGYYSEVSKFPVFHINCITHRKNPIYPATVVGKPPMEDCFIAKTSSIIFLPFIKRLIPEIVDMNLPIEGVFHNLAIVSIKKEYPGALRKVASALWGLGQLSTTKVLVMVDEDIDVNNLSDVSWRVLSNISPKRDIFFVDGPVDILDHASPYLGYGSKMAIDGTKKTKEGGMQREWPGEAIMDKNIEALVSQKWKDYGI
ncbi:MAG: menaquinone biosynthesis decarboxylase [bacterium]